jgi:hypothetical protein
LRAARVRDSNVPKLRAEGSEKKRVSDCDVHSRLPAHRRHVPVSLSHPGLVPVRPRHSTRGGPPPAGTAPVPSCAHTQPWASTQQAGDAPGELHLVALGHLRGDQRQGGVDDLRHVRLVQGFGGCAWQQQREPPELSDARPHAQGRPRERARTHFLCDEVDEVALGHNLSLGLDSGAGLPSGGKWGVGRGASAWSDAGCLAQKQGWYLCWAVEWTRRAAGATAPWRKELVSMWRDTRSSADIN